MLPYSMHAPTPKVSEVVCGSTMQCSKRLPHSTLHVEGAPPAAGGMEAASIAQAHWQNAMDYSYPQPLRPPHYASQQLHSEEPQAAWCARNTTAASPRQRRSCQLDTRSCIFWSLTSLVSQQACLIHRPKKHTTQHMPQPDTFCNEVKGAYRAWPGMPDKPRVQHGYLLQLPAWPLRGTPPAINLAHCSPACKPDCWAHTLIRALQQMHLHVAILNTHRACMYQG